MVAKDSSIGDNPFLPPVVAEGIYRIGDSSSSPVAAELLLRGIFPTTLQQWRHWYQNLFRSYIEKISPQQLEWISFNLNTEHIIDDDICDMVSNLQFSKTRLVIEWTEWTERPLMHSGDVNREVTTRLEWLRKHCGFLIAFDDVGTGEDSLGRLALIRPDIIKLSGNIFHYIHSQHINNFSFASRFFRDQIALLKQYDCQVVIEWIETREELAFAKWLGADLVQGYLFKMVVQPECLEDLSQDRIQCYA